MRSGLIAWSKGELPGGALRAARGARASRDGARPPRCAGRLHQLHPARRAPRGSPGSRRTGRKASWSCRIAAAPSSPSALSKRVQDWIERVACVGDVISGPRFGLEAGRAIAEITPGARIGVLELDDFPSGTAVELQSADPTRRARRRDRARRPAARAERRRGDRALRACRRDRAARARRNPGRRRHRCGGDRRGRRRARRGGAEDVFVAVAPRPVRDDRFVRAQGEPVQLGEAFASAGDGCVQGHWVRVARTIVARQERSREPDRRARGARRGGGAAARDGRLRRGIDVAHRSDDALAAARTDGRCHAQRRGTPARRDRGDDLDDDPDRRLADSRRRSGARGDERTRRCRSWWHRTSRK